MKVVHGDHGAGPVGESSADWSSPSEARVAYWALFVVTAVYALNIADRYVLSTLIEPIRAEFQLSDSALGLVTGVGMAIFYVTAGIPLGMLADRVNRKKMIAWALAAWSVMTAACGLSQTFVQLLIARMGVGVGEAGGTPPSQSLLADYFPPRRRLVATSIFAIGVPIGSAVGGIAAGIIAEAHGWRMAMLAAAAAGLPIFLLLLTLREPKRGRYDAAPAVAPETPPPSLRETLHFIRSRKAVFHVFAGGTVATFSGMGLIWWTPAFLARSHGLSVAEAGIEVGLMNGVGGGIALAASALLMIWLARKPVAWQCYFTALITGLITIPALLAHWVQDRELALLSLWFFIPLANVYIGPCFALIHNLVRPQMRAASVAILLFTANVANLIVAPQGIGSLSDLIRPHIGNPEESLRLALLISALTGIWGAYHFIRAGREIGKGKG
ncbi:spinster family MFS transporter [Sphingosinicella rhizophila]|uniref:MFS transporter n=1 Tax=Sphingosinicella rhizophila TaxID=3050082 RepID=A0ABU3Q629_9SPHN|nr:MFS transporter [Sphingosinicella sp. GR2756]MDT9598767.1 MFS transporter [Sphingosinicella sp. GR2756]